MAEKRKLVMGFDVGGTKTASVIIDDQGHILGRGFGGSGNTNFIPLKIAIKSFKDSITECKRMAHLAPGEKLSCVVVGTEPDPKPVAPAIKKLTGTRSVVHKKEGECSMVGGLVDKIGLSLICGTGSVGWGRNEKGETSMTSCWGPIGDEGSAYDIASRGVNAAFRAWDGRGKKTVLVDMLLKMFDKTDLRDACTPIYTSPNLRKDFASLAQLVTKAATKGDKVALQIMKDCADQVALFLATCANNLKMGRKEYKVAAPVSGLIANANYRYFKMIDHALRKIHPKAKLVKPKFEPVIGAVLIALDEIGVEWTPSLVKNLQTSWRKIK